MTEAVLADQIGIDVVALGEHHRPEYAISSPETVLAGIATATKRIRLASGVTVLSSDDPVRVFQRFATVDALSSGRAEVILGRGSFTESFPLFGYDLKDYEVLFDEKIDLFHRLLDEAPVTWEGTTRAALRDADVYPKTDSGRLNTWVGVGGSPQSVIRAAHYGFRLMLAVIGGAPTGSLPMWICTGARAWRVAPRHGRSGCTRPASSPRPTRKPRSCSTRIPGDPRPDRRPARLAADTPHGVRRRGGARLAVRGFGRDGRDQDRPRDSGAGRGPVRHGLLRRRHRFGLRTAAFGRAVRHPGHPRVRELLAEQPAATAGAAR
ncbi:LLM class flavin-dependent oxidoreductase [Streptomyces sp. M19]